MKILILSQIDRDAIEHLQQEHDVVCAMNVKDPERLKTLVADREVIVFRSGVQVTAAVMECAPNLKLLLRAGSGCDNVDVQYAEDWGIRLVRIPEPGAKAVAELAFSFMLALARNVMLADRLLRQGRWAKHELSGQLLTGKVLGIVGAGNIGSRAGQLGAAWGMKAIGCVANPSGEVAAGLHKKGIRLTGLEEVLSQSDFVSVHVPLTDSTRNLIDAKALARMKGGAYLVNLARGGVVDERALYRELTTEGRLAGAALDVHKAEGDGKVSPLAQLQNVILTPHIGASTVDTQREIGQEIISLVNTFGRTDDDFEIHPTEALAAQ